MESNQIIEQLLLQSFIGAKQARYSDCPNRRKIWIPFPILVLNGLLPKF